MRKLLLSIVLLSAAQTALAQAWPARPIRLICPYPGGPVELSSRIVAQKLQEALGQPVVVENRPGAGGVIGADYVAKAAPDGYTLLMGAIATHAINPSLMPSLPYDAMRDFRHIALNVLVVNNELPVKSVKDLIALARTRPGQLDFGSGSTGSTGHLAGELFKQMTGTFMVHIPYRSSAPAVADMLAGRVHLMFDNLASALPNIKAGKVRALAVTTTRRTDFLPDLPTLDESGLKGFNLTTWWGLMAPAKTPNEIVNRLSAETLKAMDAPDARERLRNLGSATPGVRTPEAFTAFIEAEKTLYARLVKVSGAKPD